MNIFEMLMLILFGAAWPFSLIDSIRTKTSAGRSVLFYISMIIGYISGIIHKILYNCDFTLVIYIINLIMVTACCILTIYYRKQDNADNGS